jgi:hypothetical protein
VVNIVTDDYEVRLFAYGVFRIVPLPILNTVSSKVRIRNLKDAGLLTAPLRSIGNKVAGKTTDGGCAFL